MSKMKAQNADKVHRKPGLEHWHWVNIFLMLFDLTVAVASYFLALWLRFDCQFSEIPEIYLNGWLKYMPIHAVLSVVVFALLRLYRSIWRFASFVEVKRIVLGSAIVTACHAVGITLLFQRMPITYYFIGAFVQFSMVLAIRFGYRFVLLERRKRMRSEQQARAKRVMLIGAGSAGQLILRDLHTANTINERVCCIIDDNRNKWGRFIEDVPVVGGRDKILESVGRYQIQKIVLAMPSATVAQRREILEICKEANCELKNLPAAYNMANEDITAKSLKDVAVEDLLGREPVKVNMEEIYSFIEGKVILVTGGGGSIGSELCRQIAQHNPKKLIVFDIYENNAHAIGLELRDKYPELDLEVLIGSVRDSRRINQVFKTFHPDVVYHAAAHKHVPLMEDSPCESIKNNAIGTYKTAFAAVMNGCKKFVLISTDKAVNPTNIMGASKRLCEMIIQSFDRKIREGRVDELSLMHVHRVSKEKNSQELPTITVQPATDFVAVRFGNVLGSNGSVIPRFKEQIAKGGPVTVTHPDIIRYFMTIPEAVSLVLQAGTYADGGEIFVLDMGSPMKIDTLARNLIRLSGLRPDVDIQIAYTGLRPGEKLYEEKLMSEEGMRTTPNQLIHIGCPIPFDANVFLKQLQMLMDAAYDGKEDVIRNLVAEVVPTYQPAGEHGSEKKGEVYEQQISQATKTKTPTGV